jgi:hypothetical protein
MDPLRFSVLKQISRSPAHARHAMTHESTPTAAMRFGTLSHSIFLGKGLPVVYPGERRGKAWAEFKEANQSEDIVTQEEFDRASEMAVALHSHKEARNVLLGTREQTILFDFAGRPCRATPDVFAPGAHLTELKTTQDASPERFPYIAARLSYASQLTFYKDGIGLAGLKLPEALYIVAIETKPPFVVCVFSITERMEDFARRIYRTWLERFLVCEQSNEWPGYPMGQLDAPEDALQLIGADGEEMDVAF